MAVYLGSAHGDEHGNAHGGTSGDQTGNEVSARKYYVHSKGWRVFQPKSREKGLLIARAAKAACENDKIGYDQWQRLTLYEQAKKVCFDIARVAVPCETDCSALVRVCCAYAGIDLPNFDTSTEPRVLLESGAFEELIGKQYTQSGNRLIAGTILCTSTKGHTEIVLNDGPDVKPDDSDEPGREIVVIQGGNCWVRTGPGTQYKQLGAVTAGTQLDYGGQSIDGWHLVDYKSRNGWTSGKYSKVVKV